MSKQIFRSAQFLSLALILLVVIAVHAQTSSGTISGQALAAAQGTLTNQTTGEE